MYINRYYRYTDPQWQYKQIFNGNFIFSLKYYLELLSKFMRKFTLQLSIDYRARNMDWKQKSIHIKYIYVVGYNKL